MVIQSNTRKKKVSSVVTNYYTLVPFLQSMFYCQQQTEFPRLGSRSCEPGLDSTIVDRSSASVCRRPARLPAAGVERCKNALLLTDTRTDGSV
ncbi:hypothetical protein BaRGS_00034040 [Batillaria attramentaria]|uniref:Uncharacterized protein n=1 Tax=Batillaria attramentaria TaxID=370345 RepID=A0ABD0JII0_9CAEN